MKVDIRGSGLITKGCVCVCTLKTLTRGGEMISNWMMVLMICAHLNKKVSPGLRHFWVDPYKPPSVRRTGVFSLYLYKVGALFDLRNTTPPRLLALEG